MDRREYLFHLQLLGMSLNVHAVSIVLKLIFLSVPGNILSMKMTLYHKRYVNCHWMFCTAMFRWPWTYKLLYLLLKVVVQKNSRQGIQFRRAGPRQRVGCPCRLLWLSTTLVFLGWLMTEISGLEFCLVNFEWDEVQACIVTCGGICPGLNTVIRELVCGLSHMYNVNNIYGIQVCSPSLCLSAFIFVRRAHQIA